MEKIGIPFYSHDFDEETIQISGKRRLSGIWREIKRTISNYRIWAGLLFDFGVMR